MKRGFYKRLLPFLVFPLMIAANHLAAQNPNGNRYNLAVYATGLQDGNPISTPIKNIAQNTASTNLTGGGNYQLIERSNEFLKQIEEEKHFQQSGDVADNQIAELGASYGAQKICVISITIEGDYLYVAARIVDVATITSYESGEADISGYTGIAQIRPTVVSAIKQILLAAGTNTTASTPSSVNISPTNIILPTTIAKPTISTDESDIEFNVSGVVFFKMIFVKGGGMHLGCTSNSGNCESDENPSRYVTLNDYYIGETEVTQELWKAVMGSKKNPSNWKGDLLPVEMVSWTDCQDFLSRINNLFSTQLPSGYYFALPSEAQWEYAARGGQKGCYNIFAGNNNVNLVAWYNSNHTYEVKQKGPNELGLYDLTGNVWEWCEDCYSCTYYSDNSNWTDPINTSVGKYRVLRGGSWYSKATECRVANRNGDKPDKCDSRYGFRLALVRR